MQFGCFVQLEGVRGRHEGLVHVSQVANTCVHVRVAIVVFVAIVTAGGACQRSE